MGILLQTHLIKIKTSYITAYYKCNIEKLFNTSYLYVTRCHKRNNNYSQYRLGLRANNAAQPRPPNCCVGKTQQLINRFGQLLDFFFSNLSPPTASKNFVYFSKEIT